MPHWYSHVLLPAVMGLASVCLLFLGLRALLQRRPFIVSARWLLLVILLGCLPSVVTPVADALGEPGHAVSDGPGHWILPALLVALAAVAMLQLRGYFAMAVTEASMREALLAALVRLRLPHEDRAGAVRLPSVPGELQVVVQGWMGAVQLRAATPNSRGVLDEIIHTMNDHYRTRRVGVSPVGPLLCIALGLALLATVGTLLAS